MVVLKTKKIILFLLLSFSIPYANTASPESLTSNNSFAGSYYVSEEGNDSWDGLAPEYAGGTTGPWRTLEKVNQAMSVLGGQSVYFRRGDQFEGNLQITGTGIIFGAYGDGQQPVLSGGRSLPGAWLPVEGRSNVFSVQLSEDVEDVTILMKDNISLPLGRTPNGDLSESAGYYLYTNCTQNSLTDPTLTGSEDIVGGEVIMRINNWTYSGYPITRINGTTVEFVNESNYEMQLTSSGYFFQKHLSTLDMEGEWFFDKTNHILYLYTATSPAAESFRYTKDPVVVQLSYSSNITIEGLEIEMSASLGININTCSDINILECRIGWCGHEGIRLAESTALIGGNDIHNCLAVGIHSVGTRKKVVVTRNTISKIGLIPGRGWTSGSFGGLRLAKFKNGFLMLSGNSEASYNRFSDIGYIAIHHIGKNNLIRRNVIDRYNRVTFDGGAIYTYSGQQGTIIEENIILNGMANTSGLPPGRGCFSTGIQLDAKSAGLILRNNTIITNTTTGGGFHLNYNSVNNVISGNTIVTQATGISTLDRLTSTMSGNIFDSNVIVRTIGSPPTNEDEGGAVFSLRDNDMCDLENQGIFSNNVCAVPFTGANVIKESQQKCGGSSGTAFDIFFTSASEWNEKRSYATGNLDAPVRIPESLAPDDFIQFFYNDSDEPKTFSLPAGEFLDPYGKPVTGSVTVDPWRSIVLFKSPGMIPPLNVSITVVDNKTLESIEGCQLDMNGQQWFTDDQGSVVLDSVPWGTYTLSASAENYRPLTRSITVYSDTTLVISLEPKYPRILLQVVDKAKGLPVDRAMVSYDGLMTYTDKNGEVTIEIPEAKNWGFSIEHSDYFILSDSAMITGDTTLVIGLTRTQADIRFEIKDTLGPLSNVPVSLNNFTVLTNLYGMALFSKRPARVDYDYRIEKPGYQTIQETFWLERDTTISATMEPVTGISHYRGGAIRIYPNPASGNLFVDLQETDALMELFNMEGKLLLTRKIYSGTSTLDVSLLPQGIYYLKIQTKDYSSFSKQVILE